MIKSGLSGAEADRLISGDLKKSALTKAGLSNNTVTKILKLSTTKPSSKYKSGTSTVDIHSVEENLSPDSYLNTTRNEKNDARMRHDMNMIYDKKSHTELYFDRLYSIYPDLELENVCQYVFIVRPDANIIKPNTKNKLVEVTSAQKKKGVASNSSCANDQLMRYMNKNHNNILRHLTSELTEHNDFMPYLVGRTESLQIPDLSVKNYYITQPFTGLSLPYAGHVLESMSGGGGTFDITFREDAEFKVHKLFQTWLHYIDGVTRNMFSPMDNHIANNIIDYATSVYCITCKPDAETIIYWTKYTGAFPINNPNSDTSFNLRGSVNNRVSISFAYFLAEALDPLILVDFNKNAHVDSTDKGLKKRVKDSIPIYSESKLGDYSFVFDKAVSSAMKKEYAVLGTGYGLVGSPFIYRNGDTGEYKLGWKNPYN